MNVNEVSTHASAREATRSGASCGIQYLSFYPRLREGGDALPPNLRQVASWFLPTPPRGRRLLTDDYAAIEERFLPTPPRGRRLADRRIVAETYEFLPTPPRGRRQRGRKRKWSNTRFYPRLREGGDHKPQGPHVPSSCFYPRLREGGDCGPYPYGRLALRVSTHASAREATRGAGYLRDKLAVSTHASAREATRSVAFFLKKSTVSTHASAREATHTALRLPTRKDCFYPRLREGGDSSHNNDSLTCGCGKDSANPQCKTLFICLCVRVSSGYRCFRDSAIYTVVQWSLGVRATRPSVLRDHRWAWPRHVALAGASCSPGCRSAGYRAHGR